MGKHLRTLEAIRANPTRANIRWKDIESLLLFLGATMKEGAGSRVRFDLGERTAVFHRPHPSPTVKKGVVRAVRTFLEGIEL
jgi:hypothetical protein